MTYAPNYPIIEYSLDNPAYPYLLRQVSKPPRILYCKGAQNIANDLTISIVGSRRMTPYGMRVLDMLVPDLVSTGLVIVSGLAFGVDSYAHTLALRYKGLCIAVFGTGLDIVYPSSNRGLAVRILESGGSIYSEYPEGTHSYKHHFPERNRIIAGLSMVTLIIEATEVSGTLITAREALDAGREVVVVPGDIFQETSQGVHRLLKQGAHPVCCAQDILDLYNLKLPLYGGTKIPKAALTGMQATLYDFISQGAHSTGALTEKSGFKVQDVQRTLSSLELQGLIFFKERAWHQTS